MVEKTLLIYKWKKDVGLKWLEMVFKKIIEEDGRNKLKRISAAMNVAGHRSFIKKQEIFSLLIFPHWRLSLAVLAKCATTELDSQASGYTLLIRIK